MGRPDRAAASGSLWRDALKAGRNWWVLATLLVAASVFFLVLPVGASGVMPVAGSVLGTAARIAIIVGLAGAALAGLRLATRRLADRRLASGATPEPERRRRLQTLATVAWRAGATAIVGLAVLLVLPHLGVPTTPLVAGATVGGLALTLAFQRVLKDLIAGAEFLLDDAAAVGEWVTAAGLTGRVHAFGLRALVLEGFDGTRHRIPNSAVTHLSNHSRVPAAALLEVEVGFTDDPGWLVAVCNEEAERLGTAPPAAGLVAGTPLPLGVHVLGDEKLTARVRVPCVPFAGPSLARALRDRIGARLAEDRRAIAPPFAVRALPVDEPSTVSLTAPTPPPPVEPSGDAG